AGGLGALGGHAGAGELPGHLLLRAPQRGQVLPGPARPQPPPVRHGGGGVLLHSSAGERGGDAGRAPRFWDGAQGLVLNNRPRRTRRRCWAGPPRGPPSSPASPSSSQRCATASSASWALPCWGRRAAAAAARRRRP
ncbi:unnamed protein product, partial [Heterosigma akashiwo]